MQVSNGSGRDAIVLTVFGFAFGILSAWGLFYSWGTAPATKPVDLPAWTQAIGSILAIGLAIYVPWKQRSYQIADTIKQEELERAKAGELVRIMRIAMFQSVDAFTAHCEFMLRELDSKTVDRTKLPATLFLRPTEFDQFRLQLHLLGALGHRVNKLIANQDVIRGLHGEFMRLLLPMPDQFREMYKSNIEFAAEVGRKLRHDIHDSVCAEDKLGFK